MYETPKLEVYGTFRELTQNGGSYTTDLFAGDSGGDGCVLNSNGTAYTCIST